MILTLLLAGGAALRAWSALSPRSLWGDEFYSLAFALQGGFRETLSFSLGTNHPPVYYWLLYVLSELFGQSDLVFRAPSVLSGVLLIWAVYRIGRSWYGREAGLLAAAITAFSPYFVQCSGEIRPYMLVSLLGVLTLHFLLKASERPIWIAAYAACASVLVYILHLGVFILAGATLLMIAVPALRRFWRVQAAVAFACLPWAALAVFQSYNDEGVQRVERLTEYWSAPHLMIKKTAGMLWHLSVGYRHSMLTVDRAVYHMGHSPAFWLEAAVTVVCVALVMAAIVHVFRTRHHSAAFLSGAVLLPLAFLLVIYPVRMHARYLSFAAPFIAILLGLGLSRTPRGVKIAALALLGSAYLWGNVYALSLSTDVVHKDDYKGMFRHIVRNAAPDDIAVGIDWPVRYYSRTLGVSIPCKYYIDYREIAPVDTEGADRIWVMKTGNMDPSITKGLLSEEAAHLARLGFSKVEAVRFGGPEGVTYLCVYTRG